MEAVGWALEAAHDGRGSLILLFGEAGIGESRLAREAQRLARTAGMLALWRRCVEAGEATPYRCLSEALLSGLRGRPLPLSTELPLRQVGFHLHKCALQPDNRPAQAFGQHLPIV